MSFRRLALVLACLSAAACTKPRGGQLDTLIVATDAGHAAMLQAIVPDLAEQGVHMEIQRAKDEPSAVDAVLGRRADAAVGPMRSGIDRLNSAGEPRLVKVTPVDRPGTESNEGPHVAYLVVRPDRKDDLRIRKLASSLNTPTVKTFLQDQFAGAVQPAF